MNFGCAAFGRSALPDNRFASDQRWLIGLLSAAQRIAHFARIMTIDLNHVPAAGLETLLLIGAVRNIDATINGDIVIIPHNNQLIQL